jgi:arylsulfatase
MYNYLGLDKYTATATAKLPKGKATVKMDFAYDGGKPGAGGTASLYINGKSVGSGRIEQTQFAIFSADETAGVGIDSETPVSEDYTRASSEFTGTIDKVTINLKK